MLVEKIILKLTIITMEIEDKIILLITNRVSRYLSHDIQFQNNSV